MIDQKRTPRLHVIDEKLQNLTCPLASFVLIAGIVSRTSLTQFLKNGCSLNSNTVEKLIVLLDEMAELKRTSLIAPDWSDAVNIREELSRRRQFRLAAEYDQDRVRELLESKKDGAANGIQGTIAALDKGRT